MFTIIIIAIGLSMDAFAVSISSGVGVKQLKLSNALKMAVLFGGFQAVMPVIGWLAGVGVRSYISGLDHWIAFGLLTIIGLKMIYEAFKMRTENDAKSDPFKLFTLLLLAVATSIDALVVGTTFALLDLLIVVPVIIIGCITFAFSFAGAYIGNRFGHFFENKIEIVGGMVLIGIGVKILLEHIL
ncbi:MAG: hypothetical protein COV46_07660 [Deltaproteobacteria bacterium CG11_big_fil_rev_8_21_14_0_20_49_13]|nr:MAG: hypothetical protein COV46_07660 [Deltaproteobacteria bacterium CG11_big_fil_rev_8_21_14_0_20_49_13]